MGTFQTFVSSPLQSPTGELPVTSYPTFRDVGKFFRHRTHQRLLHP